MKNKILSALKNKYKNLGLGDKAFEGVADYLAATVKEEADIETAITGVEPMLKAFQGEADKLRGENTTLKTQLAAKTETKPSDQQKPDDTKPNGDEAPAWAKAMSESINTFQKKIEALEADKVTGSRRGKLDDKLKDSPESLRNMITKNFNKMKFESDQEFDEYLTDVSAQVEEFAKEVKIYGVSVNGKSSRGLPGGGDGKKEATKEELDAVMDKLPI